MCSSPELPQTLCVGFRPPGVASTGHRTGPDGTRDPPSVVGNGRCRSWAPAGSSALGLAGRRREAARSAACWPHGVPQHGSVACVPGMSPAACFLARGAGCGAGASLQPPGHISGAEPSPATVAGPLGSKDAGHGLPLSPDGAPASCPPAPARVPARPAAPLRALSGSHATFVPLCSIPCPASGDGQEDRQPAAAQTLPTPASLLPLSQSTSLCRSQHPPAVWGPPSLPGLSCCCLVAALVPRVSALLRGALPPLPATASPGRQVGHSPAGRRAPSLCPVRSLLLDITQAHCSSRAQFLAGPWDVAVGLTPESSCAGRSIRPGEVLGPVSPSPALRL